jgi:hypothetical protein
MAIENFKNHIISVFLKLKNRILAICGLYKKGCNSEEPKRKEVLDLGGHGNRQSAVIATLRRYP